MTFYCNYELLPVSPIICTFHLAGWLMSVGFPIAPNSAKRIVGTQDLFGECGYEPL